MTEGENKTYTRALWWLAQGAHVIPLQPNRKDIVGGFGPHKKTIGAPVDCFAWFGEHPNLNLGLVLGAPAPIVCADFESMDAWQEWSLRGPGREVGTLTESSRRGVHVFFRVIGDVPPPAISPDRQTELKTRGVVTVAPSLVDEVYYRVISRYYFADVTAAQLHELFPWSKPMPRPAPARRQMPGAGDVITQIKQAFPVRVELERAGVKEWRGSGKYVLARCPFHADENPSLAVNEAAGLWWCNATSCRAYGRTNDAINARAWARHGGDTRAAIAEMLVELRREVAA